MNDKLKITFPRDINILTASSMDQFLLTQRTGTLRWQCQALWWVWWKIIRECVCFVMLFTSDQVDNCLLRYQGPTGCDRGRGRFVVKEASPGIWRTAQWCSGLTQTFPETALEEKSIFRKRVSAKNIRYLGLQYPSGWLRNKMDNTD